MDDVVVPRMNNNSDFNIQQVANYLPYVQNQNVNRNNQNTTPNNAGNPGPSNRYIPVSNQPQTYINGNGNQAQQNNVAMATAWMNRMNDGRGNMGGRGNAQLDPPNHGAVAIGGPGARQVQQQPGAAPAADHGAVAAQLAQADEWIRHYQHQMDIVNAYKAGLQFREGGADGNARIAAAPVPAAIDQGLNITIANGTGHVVGAAQLNGGMQNTTVERTYIPPARAAAMAPRSPTSNVDPGYVVHPARLTVDPRQLSNIPSIQPPANASFHPHASHNAQAGPSRVNRYEGLARSPEAQTGPHFGQSNGTSRNLHVDTSVANGGTTLAVSSQPVASPSRSPSSSSTNLPHDIHRPVAITTASPGASTSHAISQQSGQGQRPAAITPDMIRNYQIWSQRKREEARRKEEAAEQARQQEIEEAQARQKEAEAAERKRRDEEAAEARRRQEQAELERRLAEAAEDQRRKDMKSPRGQEDKAEGSEGSGAEVAVGDMSDAELNDDSEAADRARSEALKNAEMEARHVAAYAAAALQKSPAQVGGTRPSPASPPAPSIVSAQDTSADPKQTQAPPVTAAPQPARTRTSPPQTSVTVQRPPAARPGLLRQAESWRQIRREIQLPPIDGRNIYPPFPEDDKENEALYFDYRTAEMLHRGIQDIGPVTAVEIRFVKRLIRLTAAKGLDMLYASMYEDLRGRVEKLQPRPGPAKRLLEMLKQKGLNTAAKRTASGQIKEAADSPVEPVAAPLVAAEPQQLVYVNGNAYRPTENALVVAEQNTTVDVEMAHDDEGVAVTSGAAASATEQPIAAAEVRSATTEYPVKQSGPGERSTGKAGGTVMSANTPVPTRAILADSALSADPHGKKKKPLLLPVNMREVRSIPSNRVYVEIPTKRAPRVATPVTRVFDYADPEPLPFRFNRQSKNPVLGESLVQRKCLRYCEWEGCDAELSSEWHLEQHMRRHLKSGMLDKQTPEELDAWTCCWEDCATYLYATQDDLYQHVKAVHVQKSFRCPYSTCSNATEKRPKVYPTITSLEGHIARHPDQHKKQAVVPIMGLQKGVPRTLPIPAIIPGYQAASQVVVHRGVWATSRSKRIGINLVQEMSFIDKESPKMTAGEEPHSMDVPPPTVIDLLGDSDSELETALEGGLGSSAVRVKQEVGEEPAQSAKRAVRKQEEKEKEGESKFDIIMEIKRPVIWGR